MPTRDIACPTAGGGGARAQIHVAKSLPSMIKNLDGLKAVVEGWQPSPVILVGHTRTLLSAAGIVTNAGEVFILLDGLALLDLTLKASLPLFTSPEVQAMPLLARIQHVAGLMRAHAGRGTGALAVQPGGAANPTNKAIGGAKGCVASFGATFAEKLKSNSSEYMDTKRAALLAINAGDIDLALSTLLRGYLPPKRADGSSPPRLPPIGVFATIIYGKGDVVEFDAELEPLTQLRSQMPAYLGRIVLEYLKAPKLCRVELTKLYESFCAPETWKTKPPDFPRDAWKESMLAIHKGSTNGGLWNRLDPVTFPAYSHRDILACVEDIFCIVLRETMAMPDEERIGGERMRSPIDVVGAARELQRIYGCVNSLADTVQEATQMLISGVLGEIGQVIHAARVSRDCGADMVRYLVCNPSSKADAFITIELALVKMLEDHQGDKLRADAVLMDATAALSLASASGTGRRGAKANSELSWSNVDSDAGGTLSTTTLDSAESLQLKVLAKELERLKQTKAMYSMSHGTSGAGQSSADRRAKERGDALKKAAAEATGKFSRDKTEWIFGTRTYDVKKATESMIDILGDDAPFCLPYSLLHGNTDEQSRCGCSHASDHELHRKPPKDFVPRSFRTDSGVETRERHVGAKAGSPHRSKSFSAGRGARGAGGGRGAKRQNAQNG